MSPPLELRQACDCLNQQRMAEVTLYNSSGVIKGHTALLPEPPYKNSHYLEAIVLERCSNGQCRHLLTPPACVQSYAGPLRSTQPPAENHNTHSCVTAMKMPCSDLQGDWLQGVYMTDTYLC